MSLTVPQGDRIPVNSVLRSIEEKIGRIAVYPNRLRRVRQLCRDLSHEANVLRRTGENKARVQSIEGLLRRTMERCQSWGEMSVLDLLTTFKEDMDAFENDARNLQFVCEAFPAHEATLDRGTAFPLLKRVLSTSEGRRSVSLLQGPGAGGFLGLLQEELDAPVSDHDARFRSAAIKVMTQVARGTGRLPPALWMSNIVHGEHATTGGGFGDVYLGSWGDKEVALKFLRHFTRQSNAEMEKQFYQEALLWRQLSHEHILPFLGVYQEGPRLAMVSPWKKNGNILQYLNKCPNPDRYKLLTQATNGLLYLHQQEPPVIHSDLKPGNILIDDNGTAILADFGFSRIQHDLSGSISSSLRGGTRRYTSPELLLDESNKSIWSSDIWALGMVIYEVFTGETPFSEIQGDAAIFMAIRRGTIPQKPKYAAVCLGFTDDLWKFLEESCWAKTAAQRPNASYCSKRLRELTLRWAHEKAAKAASPRVMNEVRLLPVPPRYGRSLVEPGTSHLQSLSERFGVKIEVVQSYTSQGENRFMLKLVGDKDNMKTAETGIRSDVEGQNEIVTGMYIPHARHPALLGAGQMAEICRQTRTYIRFPGGLSGYGGLAEPENFADLMDKDPQDIVRIRGTREGCKEVQGLLEEMVEDQKRLERQVSVKAKYHHDVLDRSTKELRELGVRLEFGDQPPRPLSPQPPVSDSNQPSWRVYRRHDPRDVAECTWILKGPTKAAVETGQRIVARAVKDIEFNSCIGLLTFPTSTGFGRIVGPGGETVQRLQAETRTTIVVPAAGKGSTIRITGSRENIETAKDRIKRLLQGTSTWRTVASASF